MSGQPPDDDALEILGVTPLYQGFHDLIRATARHRRRDGTWSRPYGREVFMPGLAVAVLPYDPARDRVVLIEQQRVPARFAGLPTLMIEVVAGLAEDGEDAEEVGRRELEEEAGLTAGAMVRVADFMPSPGSNSARFQLYFTQVDSAGAGGWHGLEEEDEEVRAFPATAQEVETLLREGRITNGLALVALQWFLLNHKTLQSGALPEPVPAP